MQQSMNTITLADLQEQRNRLSAAAAALTNSNQIYEFNEAIRNLDAAFTYFEKHGQFDSGERKAQIYPLC